MYGEVMDALRSLLHSNFPDITRIYVSTMPDSFNRPSFFLNLATSDDEHLNRAIYQTKMTWQIVFFAPMDSKGQANVFEQFSVSSALKKVLMEAIALRGSKGTIYDIIETEGGPRDAEVYITVSLQAEMTRPKPEHELIKTIEHNSNANLVAKVYSFDVYRVTY